MHQRLIFADDLTYPDLANLPEVGFKFDPLNGRRQIDTTTDEFTVSVLPTTFGEAQKAPAAVHVQIYPAGSISPGITVEELADLPLVSQGSAVPSVPGDIQIKVGGLEPGGRYAAAILADFD